MDEYILPILT